MPLRSDHPGLPRWASNPMSRVLVRDTQRRDGKKRRHTATEAENVVATGQGVLQPAEAG